MGQVAENTESQRRQYALAEQARSIGFVPHPMQASGKAINYSQWLRQQ
jgi:hypothetical protein